MEKTWNARHMFQILARLLGVSGIPINQKEATCNFTPSLIGNCDLVFNVFRGNLNWMSPCDLIIEIQAYKIPSEVKQFYKWILEGLIHICWPKAFFVLKLWKIANLIWKVGIYINGEDLILTSYLHLSMLPSIEDYYIQADMPLFHWNVYLSPFWELMLPKT